MLSSSGNNPFDDDGDCSGSGGGGGEKVVGNQNPFEFDDDCEEISSRESAPHGKNPFDNDDCSDSSNFESTDSIGRTSRFASDSNLSKSPLADKSVESERASVDSETPHIELSRNNDSDSTESSGNKCDDNSSVCDEYCSESDPPDEYLDGDEEAQVLHQKTLDTEANSRSQQACNEHWGKNDIKEAAKVFNRDENDRYDMPQSSLCAANHLSEETGGERTTLSPMLENDNDSYWNKEAVREAVSSFDEKCAQEQTKRDDDVEDPLTERNNLPREPGVMRSSVRRKKVKNRYCKAAVMVTVVWAAMIILVSVALGMDWLGVNKHFDQTKSESLCTLCDRNSSIGPNNSTFTLRPTRKPSSSSQSTFSVAAIKPPPENLSELCAPSILLDHGSDKVASNEKLVTACATTCLPAACCVSDNEQAKQALTTMFESQGMGTQAATIFSTIEDCNRGSNVGMCNAYNDFCSTLYDIDHALDSMQKHFHKECIGPAEITSISPRRRRSDKCNEICASLACCYETDESTFATEIKRNREHIESYTNLARGTMESRQIGEGGCDGFTRPAGSLNAQICNTYSSAYSIFCKSQDIPRTSTPTSSPSYQSSKQSSYRLTQSPTTRAGSLIPSVESPSSHPTTNSSPASGLVNSTASQPSTTVPSSFIIQPNNLPTITAYPTQNSSSVTNNTSVPSSSPSNTSYGDFISSQHPTFSSLPTRDVLETLNSSFFPSMMPSVNDKFIAAESSLPTLALNSSQSSSLPLTCSIVNASIFSSLLPNQIYSHAGFCAALEAWNTNNATTNIFAADDEMSLRHELAAFFSHLPVSRELPYCRANITDASGRVYCKPDAYEGGNYSDPYCSTSQEEECECGPVPESLLFPGYIESDKLFYGRGPLHLTWNYNYLEVAEVLGLDLCSRPDLVASEEGVGWASTFWTWTSITASSTGYTSANSVAEGSYGGTLNAIKGDVECQAGIYSSDFSDEVATRLNYYCNAASILTVDNLFANDGCGNLQSLFDTCKTVGTCPACRDFR